MMGQHSIANDHPYSIPVKNTEKSGRILKSHQDCCQGPAPDKKSGSTFVHTKDQPKKQRLKNHKKTGKTTNSGKRIAPTNHKNHFTKKAKNQNNIT